MGKVRKHETFEYEEDFLDWAIRKLQASIDKDKNKKKQEAELAKLERKHQVKFVPKKK